MRRHEEATETLPERPEHITEPGMERPFRIGGHGHGGMAIGVL